MAFGSFLGAIAGLLPGYVEGQRQAVKDNWNDLNQYSDVQAKQLSNLFTEATWQPRLDMVSHAGTNSFLGMYNNIMNTLVNEAAYPGAYWRGATNSMFAPQQAYQDNLMGLMAQIQYMNDPSTMWKKNLFPQGMNPAPSAV